MDIPDFILGRDEIPAHAARPAHPTQMELSLLLSDLGMLSGVNQEADERFVRNTFRKMDVDESGYIDFEEFKVIYNKAIDRKKGNDEIADLPPLRGRDVKALSPEVESQRRRIAERKAQEKAERESMLAEENRRRASASPRLARAAARTPSPWTSTPRCCARRWPRSLAPRRRRARRRSRGRTRRARGAGRGCRAYTTTGKALDEKTLADRRAVAERRRLEKEAREAQLAEENQRMRERIAAGKAQGRDAKALDEEDSGGPSGRGGETRGGEGGARGAARRGERAHPPAHEPGRPRRQGAHAGDRGWPPSRRGETRGDKGGAERKIREENAAFRARLNASRSAGRDAKELTPEIEAGRAAVAQRRREEKAAREAKLAEENAEYARRVSSTRAKDVKGLDEKTLADRRAVAERRAAEKAERERTIAEENAALARRRSSLHGRDAKALDDVTEAARREVEGARDSPRRRRARPRSRRRMR